MNPRLLQYFNSELQHLREMGAEFARQYPKVAGRLSLDEFECADPYVERLLEGFAFLTSRIQLKLDAEYPQLTHHLLDVVYPGYLAPLPSMAIVRMQPDMKQTSLTEGHLIPRHTALRGQMGRGDQTACEYRTAHDVTLWPIEIVDAGYFSRSAAAIDLPAKVRDVKATIRLTLKTNGIPMHKVKIDELPLLISGSEQLPMTLYEQILADTKATIRLTLKTNGIPMHKVKIDEIPLLISGSEQLPMTLYEQILADTKAIVIRPAKPNPPWQRVLSPENVTAHGFDPDQALLPPVSQSFQGYRLLQEYFAFPQRFMFIRLKGLQDAFAEATEDKLEIIFALDKGTDGLDGRVSQSNFSLYCTPAINLFPKVTDRIHLNDNDNEHHVVPDRTRPLDFEIHSIKRVTGYGAEDREGQAFHPFYASFDVTEDAGNLPAYFTTTRQTRRLSDREKRVGSRSSYLGDDVFLALVDTNQAPYRHDLRQLRVEALCTNRDLPLQMPLGFGDTDFSLNISAPILSVRCVSGPTKPVASRANRPGNLLWQLVGSLTLNYLSLSDLPDGRGAMAIRDLLALFVAPNDTVMHRQAQGVRSVRTKRVVRRVPGAGPITFGRGLEVAVTMDESAFDGSGPYLLGSVLKEFFAKYVSMNSFAETVLLGATRGEIKRWPAIIGSRSLL